MSKTDEVGGSDSRCKDTAVVRNGEVRKVRESAHSVIFDSKSYKLILVGLDVFSVINMGLQNRARLANLQICLQLNHFHSH